MKLNLRITFLLLFFAGSGLASKVKAQSVFINEIHYDNIGTDEGEAIEIAGPAGTDLNGWRLVLYNGAATSLKVYNTANLTQTIPNLDGSGYGMVTVTYPANGIQNGDPDGMALVDAAGVVVQFLSYGGTFTAADGPAQGLTSTDILVKESNTSTPIGYSLQLAGTGKEYSDFTWAGQAPNTFGNFNANQLLGSGGGGTSPEPEPEPEPDPVPSPSKVIVFINELHYDNTGTDVNEGVEVAGLAGTDLTGWSLVPYNGSNGATYSPIIALTGIISDQQNGFGTIFFPIAGLQNGDPDGIALVDPSGKVVQFLSYEGVFTATNGPANGMASVDIGVSQGAATPIGYSLQLTGIGSAYEDFTWAPEAASTTNKVNNGQVFLPLGDVAFINEIHYDNAGVDVNEGVEVAGKAGVDLTGWRLIPYNGSNGLSYSPIVTLSGVLPNQQNGFGTAFFPISGLQNGAPDGIALVNAADSVLQFLSYEGTFIAKDGPANGITSTDIGVMQDGNDPVNTSLQLTGNGFLYKDFTWSNSIASTYNEVNLGQSFGAGASEPEPQPDPIETTVAEARALPIGTLVTVNGTLTAANEFGGPAFIQDHTGGIGVFNYGVHGTGAYHIGDSIQVTGAIGAFNQQLQLVDITNVESLGVAKAPIQPTVASIAELANLEGQLVVIPNATFTDTRGLLFPESNFSITDGTGTTQLRIDGDVQSLVGRVKPQGSVAITGIVGSFRGAVQLLPRALEDLPGTAAYVAVGSEIPVSKTLDVMTWNIAFFGSTLPTFGPTDVQLQLQNAKTLIETSKADIIAVQEISDERLLQQLVSMLPGYELMCSDRFSYSFNGPDPAFPEQKLCFIYNTAVVKAIDERVVFEEMYDAARTGASTPLDNYPTSPSSFWSSGRLPYMLTVDATIEGVTERINLINIHAKSGSSRADLTRKFYDIQALKDTLDQYYPNANIILLGDYNDDVDESIGGGTTTYDSFVSSDNFKVVTSTLSEAGLRSFITQDNVIDHIAISNELYDNHLIGSESLFVPFNLITNYANTTSDHMPVFTRFTFGEPLTVEAGADQTVYFGYAPAACATLTASAATGGAPGYTYTWSTGDTGQSVTVCPEATTVYYVTVTDANGTAFTDSVQVNVIDVNCDSNANDEKVLICFNPTGRQGHETTLCVSANAVAALLAKGATLGSCNGGKDFTVDVTFSVSPNPVADNINITFGNMLNGEVEVALYNKDGQEVYRKAHAVAAGKLILDARSIRMVEGMYYLRIGNGRDIKSLKLLKI